MTTENTSEAANLPDVEATEATPEAKTTESSEPVNWEERATAAEAKTAEQTTAFDELTQRFKSLEGRTKKADSTEARLTRQEEVMGALGDKLSILLDGVQGRDAENLDTRMGTVDSQLAQTRSRSEAEAIQADFQGSTLDGEGNAILDWQNAPELSAARATFNQGLEQARAGALEQGFATMRSGTAEVKQQVSIKRQSLHTQEIADLKKEHKAAMDKLLEDNGVGDLTAGGQGSAGSSVPTTDTIDVLHFEGKVTDDEYREFLRSGTIKGVRVPAP